jgi:cephalosporin hydroxylase
MIDTQPVTITTRDFANAEVYNRQASVRWRGVVVDKCLFDLLTYQEIIHALDSDIIIETGAWAGGSALFFADICALNGRGEVLSIDLDPPRSEHARLTFLKGDSASSSTLAAVEDWAKGRSGLVVLDSDHTQAHVLAELDTYASFVAVGSYLVVEDTNINGHPVRSEFGPGPWEAVQEWLPAHPEFAVDTEIAPFITFAPGGYLRRVY